MLGLFPPHSRVIFLRLLAAAFMMALPVAVLPVKAILSTPIWPASALPATEPRPGMMLTTPGGRPASMTRLPKYIAERGVCSAGLRTTVLPHARAGATFQASIMKGKFLGLVNTPSCSMVLYWDDYQGMI